MLFFQRVYIHYMLFWKQPRYVESIIAGGEVLFLLSTMVNHPPFIYFFQPPQANLSIWANSSVFWEVCLINEYFPEQFFNSMSIESVEIHTYIYILLFFCLSAFYRKTVAFLKLIWLWYDTWKWMVGRFWCYVSFGFRGYIRDMIDKSSPLWQSHPRSWDPKNSGENLRSTGLDPHNSWSFTHFFLAYSAENERMSSEK